MHRQQILLITLVLAIGLAPATGAVGQVAQPDGEVSRYVVVHAAPSLAAYDGGVAGLAATDPSVIGEAALDVSTPDSVAYLAYLAAQQGELLAAVQLAIGRAPDVAFRYEVTTNALALDLTSGEADIVSALPQVARVVAHFDRELLTDAGPQWIGAPAVWDGTAAPAAPGTRGEGVVVGVIDTGINHDHPSFAEVGPVDGYVHTNPRGTFYGQCDPLTGLPFCNDKLIGAHDFTGTTPEDTNLHGSHTASTTVGNVLDAQLFAPTMTYERRISGVAPHANLITYKACVTSCPITAILASIDQATADMVDVINYSIGGSSSDPWADLDSQAFLNARRAGVFVASSAGNSGPEAETVGSPADSPWVTAVGASTHNRKLINALIGMTGGATPGPADMEGKSLTSAYDPHPIVYAGDFGDPLCQTPFPPGTWTNGEIVVCDRGITPRVEKARNVQIGGAGGFVLANEEASGNSTVADAYELPGVNIGFDDGVALKQWLADGGSGHTAAIRGTNANEDPANGDVMAAFSSRGPNPSVPDVVKPDVTAPGVDVLAAFNTTNPLAAPEFGVISGTSMSSPHTAGTATLLRALRPDWTPDEVRSALMTTAFTTVPGPRGEVHGVLKEDATTPADPFDMGAGRVDAATAAAAGLTLDESPEDYDAANPALGGEPRDLNIPSLGDSACAGTCTWTRTVRNSLDREMTWSTSTQAPDGVGLTAQPSSFTLAPGGEQAVIVTADVTGATSGERYFAEVRIVPADPEVPESHLPVALVAQLDGEPVPKTALSFQGNLDEGCTGDGRADLTACDGPFLLEKPELDANPAARWGPVTPGVDGTNARNIYDPNWVWRPGEPVEIKGPMTVEWWASCGACNNIFSADWTLRLWADDVLAFEQRVTATPAEANVPSRLISTVVLPDVITATTELVLQIDPVYIDSQQNTFIYYDSTQGCDGLSDGPCDSLVRLPILGQGDPDPDPGPGPDPSALPDLEVSDIKVAQGGEPVEGSRVRITARITNGSEADAGPSQTEFRLDDGSVLGLVETPAIPAGGSAKVSVRWDTTGQQGDHVITVTADATDTVVEEDEENNADAEDVEVRPRGKGQRDL